MEELVSFFEKYGVGLTLIALAGVAILGLMKYYNLFKKLDEKKRHYIYLVISVGFSVLAAAIYLACVGTFEVSYFLAVSAALYALNQAFYTTFKVTPVNKMTAQLWDFIVKIAKSKNATDDAEGVDNKKE